MSSTQRWLSHKGEVSSEEDKGEQRVQTDTCIRRTEEGREFKKERRRTA